MSANRLFSHRPREYQLEDGPWDPVSGVASALLGTFGSLAMGVADLPTDFYHALKTQVDNHATSSTNSSNRLAALQSKDASTASLPVTRTETAKYEPTRPTDDSTMSLPLGVETVTSHGIDQVLVSEDEVEPSLKTLPTTKSDDSFIPTPPSRSSTILDRTDPTSPLSFEALSKHRPTKAGRDAAHVGEFLLKAPMDLISNISSGFHNAPRLYGDTTVRQTESITGFQSGAKAAGKELFLGVFDGVSGLVTQPVAGVKEHGVAGLLSGVVKGVGGLVLKPTGAITGLPANLLKGLYKELEKSTDFCLQTHITLSRVAQGLEDAKLAETEPGLEAEVIQKWRLAMIAADERAKDVECAITGKKHKVHHGLRFHRTRHMTFREAEMHTAEKGLKKSEKTQAAKLRSEKEIVDDSDYDTTDTGSILSTDSEEGVKPKMEVQLPNGKILKKHMTLHEVLHRLKTGELREHRGKHGLFHGKDEAALKTVEVV
jgi:hypothetical protein